MTTPNYHFIGHGVKSKTTQEIEMAHCKQNHERIDAILAKGTIDYSKGHAERDGQRINPKYPTKEYLSQHKKSQQTQN